MIKIYKLFNIPILRIETYKDNIDVPVKSNKKPEGEVLEYSQSEDDRRQEREGLKKMERRE